MDLLKLAKRCEQATGPDRDLDEAIAELLEPGLFCRDQHGRLRKNLHGTALTPRWDLWQPPSFTASLDAAMTLVPEGWAYKIGRSWCELWPISSELTDEQWPEDWDDDKQHHGKSPALALCAAALRARAAAER